MSIDYPQTIRLLTESGVTTIDLREIAAVVTATNTFLSEMEKLAHHENAMTFQIHMKSGTIFSSKRKTDLLDDTDWFVKWMRFIEA